MDKERRTALNVVCEDVRMRRFEDARYSQRRRGKQDKIQNVVKIRARILKSDTERAQAARINDEIAKESDEIVEDSPGIAGCG